MKRININKQWLNSVIYIVISLFILALYFVPQVKYLVGYVELSGLLIGFAILYILPHWKNRTKLYKPLLWSGLFCLTMFLFGYPFNIKYGFLLPMMIMWISIFPAFIFDSIEYRKNLLEKKIIAVVCLFVFLWILWVTIDKMGEYQNIVRLMTAGSTDKSFVEEMIKEGVGGFGFAYSAGMFSVFLFGLFLTVKQRPFLKMIVLAVVLFTFYFVFNAQFATLIIITLFACTLSLVLSLKSIFFKILIILGFPLLIFFIPMVFTLFANIYQETSIGTKFQGIVSTFQGGNISEISGVRSEYQLATLKLFFNNPFGNDISTAPNANIYVATHSTFISFLAATGVLGTFFYLNSLWCVYKLTISQYSKRIKNIVIIPTIVYFLLLMILNPISEAFELFFTFFFLVPLLLSILKPRINDSEKTMEK